MDCDRSKALVSVYLDGELSEELAAPLRRHLLDCAACRAFRDEAQAMSGWFVPGPEVGAPAGFAARVARRAFVGEGTASGPRFALPSVVPDDLRDLDDVFVPAAGPRVLARAGGAERGAREGGSLSFARTLTAMAAAGLFGLTLLLANGDRQHFDGSELHADGRLEDTLRSLEVLNEKELAEAAAKAASEAEPTAGEALVTPAPDANR
ncbi:MAG: zf-HC2 domain-containing protein [Planctomycetota bacterium]